MERGKGDAGEEQRGKGRMTVRKTFCVRGKGRGEGYLMGVGDRRSRSGRANRSAANGRDDTHGRDDRPVASQQPSSANVAGIRAVYLDLIASQEFFLERIIVYRRFTLGAFIVKGIAL